MPKYKVLAVVNNEDTRIDLRSRLRDEEEIALVGVAGMDTSVLTKIKSYSPHVVLLFQEEGDVGVMEIAERIYQGFPGCGMILISPNQDLGLMEKAMNAGIRRVLSLDNIDDLKDVIIKAAVFEQARAVETGREPRIVSIYSGRGGSGKTTIATNLAVSLAKSGRRVALVDLCLCFGDAALFLNINVKDTIAELVQEKMPFTIDDIKNFSMMHPSGVMMLCSPSSPKYAEYVTPQHVETILSLIRPYFDFVIVDLPCELSESTLTALESSDDILMISKKDISNLRATKMMLSILNTLQQQDKVKVVINCDYKSVLTYNDFKRVLEIPVRFSIPEDIKTARQSQERGTPFVSGMPTSLIAKGVKKIASYLLKVDDRSGKK